ncbi:DJ-1 family glyoxalase III [Thalassolituus sp. LLYu03]|uniref:DJ-1 family glyoxalase III n=1 Tax=Thalassolituus sp. LLYu03 TaxID=3421656 RepID=UPI003D286463
MANALVAIADGSEDIETITITDTLRRAGVQVTLASVMPGLQVTCAHGTRVTADALMRECTGQVWDAVIAPGGMPGAEHLAASVLFQTLLKQQAEEGRLVAAICASPAVVLAKLDLLDGKTATCYPGFEDALLESAAALKTEAVVRDGNLITSRGPATALAFALAIAEALCGAETAARVGRGMLAF